jgi:hypothetical protein
LGVIAVAGYIILTVKAALWLTGDGSNAIIGIIVPLLLLSCYYWARDQVESELRNEQDLIEKLSRDYDR